MRRDLALGAEPKIPRETTPELDDEYVLGWLIDTAIAGVFNYQLSPISVRGYFGSIQGQNS